MSFGFKQSESQNTEVVDTEDQNSELQTQVPQTWKTPSSVASPSNSGALQVIGTKLCDSSGNGAIDEYQANQWIELMNQHGVSYCGWNISNKGETSAIFGTWCSKTSGWSIEDLSPSGKWQYEMLSKYKTGL